MAYKCDICGKNYDTRAEYVQCVNDCNLKEAKKEAEAQRLAEEQRQKELRKEVDNEKANVEFLQKQYLDAVEAFLRKYPNEPLTLQYPSGTKVTVCGKYCDVDPFDQLFKPLFWW